MKIKSSQTKSLPNFPILKSGKSRRICTKHFTNLPLWLSQDEVAMINWLMYRISADNTFKYSVGLLNQYSMSVLKAREEYQSPDKNLKTITTLVRRCLLGLIEKGLILNTGKSKYYMLNPMLTYEVDVINKKAYAEIMELYQQGNIEEITCKFSKLVADFLESKKKNYIYRLKK